MERNNQKRWLFYLLVDRHFGVGGPRHFAFVKVKKAMNPSLRYLGFLLLGLGLFLTLFDVLLDDKALIIAAGAICLFLGFLTKNTSI